MSGVVRSGLGEETVTAGPVVALHRRVGPSVWVTRPDDNIGAPAPDPELTRPPVFSEADGAGLPVEDLTGGTGEFIPATGNLQRVKAGNQILTIRGHSLTIAPVNGAAGTDVDLRQFFEKGLGRTPQCEWGPAK